MTFDDSEQSRQLLPVPSRLDHTMFARRDGLRGFHGRRTMLMQCQSCHGSMSEGRIAHRTGWLHEPNAGAATPAIAMSNSGQIRYTRSFETNGPHAGPDRTTPLPPTPTRRPLGISLYRFSSGHGGLQCSACHGSTQPSFRPPTATIICKAWTLQGHVGSSRNAPPATSRCRARSAADRTECIRRIRHR